MAGLLSANLEDLNVAIDNFETADKEFNQLISDLEYMQVALIENWEGDASNAFQNVMNQYIGDISDFQSTFREIKDYLDTFQKEVEEIDRVLCGLLGIFRGNGWGGR